MHLQPFLPLLCLSLPLLLCLLPLEGRCETTDTATDDDNDGKGSSTVFCFLPEGKNFTKTFSSIGGKLPVAGNLSAVDCTWTLNVNTTSANKVFFFVERLDLGPNDNITIDDTTDAKKPLNLYSFTGALPSGFLFTGASGNLTVVLKTTIDKITRSFHVSYGGRDDDQQIIDGITGSGKLMVPIGFPNNKTKDKFNHRIRLIAKDSLNKQRLVVRFDRLAEDQTKVEVKDGKWKDWNIKDASDVLANEEEVTIEFNSLSLTSANKSIISYKLVDYNCSSFDATGKFEVLGMLSTPSDMGNFQSLDCLWILHHSNPEAAFTFDFDKVQFFGPADVLTFRNGSRFDSNVVLQVHPDNLKEVKNSYLSRISPGNSLWISFTSPFISEPTAKVVLTPQATALRKSYAGPKDTVITVAKSDEKLTPTMVYQTSSDKKVLLQSSAKTLAAGFTLNVYDNVYVNSEPYLTVKENQLVPESIWSSTNILRVELSVAAAFTATFKTVEAGSSTALGVSDSFSISGKLACGNTASWLIPANYTNPTGAFALQTPILALNATKECLTLYKYSGNDKKPVFTFCGEDGSSYRTNALPDILLSATFSYLLVYTRAPVSVNCVVDDKVTLLQASFLYSARLGCSSTLILGDATNHTIAPSSYPNSYALTESDLNVKNCGWEFQNPNKFIYVTFIDYDIANGHNFVANYYPDIHPDKFNASRELPPDRIYPNRTLFHLLSPLENESKFTPDQILSGKGFKMNVSSADCGGYIDASQKSNLSTLSYPQPAGNFTKCMWIVRVENKPKEVLGGYPVINFTVGWGSGDVNENLVIYDNPTLRDLKRVNITDLTNSSSSLDTMIVVYTIKNAKKPARGLNITWKIQDCPTNRTCGDDKRCILPNWVCNNVNDCGDWMDEYHCNGSLPIPPPKPCPEASSGVSGWIIVLLIIPMSMIVGTILTIFGPAVFRRVRGGRYQEFRDFAEVS